MLGVLGRRRVWLGVTPRLKVKTWRDPLGMLSIIMMTVGVILLSIPVVVTVSDMPSRTAVRKASTVLNEGMLNRAAAYDASLLNGSALAVGEAEDPFSSTGEPAYKHDKAYQKQLGSGSAMAMLRIPRIGLSLPVGHGTSQGTLETQAGHVYGTVLPIGDPGTSVIAGHRGLGSRVLFYRLGELSVGDMVYTAAGGRTVAWQVDRVFTVDPGSDEETQVVSAGNASETALVLYTCDPPGLNTRRLIVHTVRVPYVEESMVKGQTDPVRMWGVFGGAGLGAMLLARLTSRVAEPVRHGRRNPY